jgi:hypothetical protein
MMSFSAVSRPAVLARTPPGVELGAGIGNLIRKSKDRHRIDKLCEEALKAILAEEQ